jgi:Uma2 family endonuclease
VASSEFPRRGRICFLNRTIWADFTPQQVYSHIRIKAEITMTVGGLIQQEESGEYFGDGLRWSNDAAGFSSVPDATYYSNESFRAGRVRWVVRPKGDATELQGSPDWVAEVVSDSSVDKDTEWLMRAYWEAGVREYWVIDARSDPLQFAIHKHGPKGFVAVRPAAGWRKSAVLGRSFRFEARTNPLGHADFALRVK